MGHIRLGVLPTSRKWRQVVEHLRLGADADLIAAVTADAAEASLKRASYDPRSFTPSGFSHKSPSQPGALSSLKNCVVLVCRCPIGPVLWISARLSRRQSTSMRANTVAAPTSARWRKWPPWRASPQLLVQTCPHCSGRRQRNFNVLLGGLRAALHSAFLPVSTSSA